MMATPARPSRMPPTRFRVRRSPGSRVRRWARMVVKSGVVAMRIAARPPGMRVWASMISPIGRRLLSTPMPTKAPQAAQVQGIAWPATRTRSSRAAAPMTTRPSTMVSGGSSTTSRPLNMNDPPQRMERPTRIAHLAGPMFFAFASLMPLGIA
jgi:hypothetical protein